MNLKTRQWGRRCHPGNGGEGARGGGLEAGRPHWISVRREEGAETFNCFMSNPPSI